MYRRARDYGLRGLGATAVERRAAPDAAPRDRRSAPDVALLYWTAASWAALIGLSKEDPDALARAAAGGSADRPCARARRVVRARRDPHLPDRATSRCARACRRPRQRSRAALRARHGALRRAAGGAAAGAGRSGVRRRSIAVPNSSAPEAGAAHRPRAASSGGSPTRSCSAARAGCCRAPTNCLPNERTDMHHLYCACSLRARRPLAACTTPPQAQDAVRIRLGTLAPRGTTWHRSAAGDGREVARRHTAPAPPSPSTPTARWAAKPTWCGACASASSRPRCSPSSG